MKSLTKLMLFLFCVPLFLSAQDEAESSDAPDYVMVELTYMKAKPGMEMKFVEAVKKHNAKYHTEGPYDATLFYIRTGNEAGWYVWAMGGLTYTDLDGAPGKGAHRDDWSKSVAPYIQEIGRVEMWRYNQKLSVTDGKVNAKQTNWFMDIERDEFYRFRAFMEKIHKIFDSKNEEMAVWMNQFEQGDGRDVAIVWPFDKWADLDEEDWKMKDAYDEEYGEGSWDNALEEWKDVMSSMKQEVWLRVPKD